MSSTMPPSVFPVRDRARELMADDGLTTLANRKPTGIQLAGELRAWMAAQPMDRLMVLDFAGIRAVTASVAEELGPILMQAVSNDPSMDQRYPVYRLEAYEPVYTFHRAFMDASWNALASVIRPDELAGLLSMFDGPDDQLYAVLGALSTQTADIIRLAEERATLGVPLTSDQLLEAFDIQNGPARSKRLSELYARRLLAYRRNPRDAKERLFSPIWRLDGDELSAAR